tara:strand:+ start:1886 stop:2578 length:693 start_codon:yes stop_codon:yes gene_type:complete
MYKNKQFKKLEKKYSEYQDSGSVGFFMNICHKNLEVDIKNDAIEKRKKKILEIGAGTSPHINYLNNDYEKYFFLENSKFSIKYLKKRFKKNKKIHYKLYSGKNIPFKASYFDRVIISHVLEHIPNPENFIEEMMKKLKPGGKLSISLPCDPGLLWRFGRFFLKIFSVRKKLGISKKEYDYMIATEHINSIFNLISILKYKFSKNIVSEYYLPFRIKIIDFNLFYNITLIK